MDNPFKRATETTAQGASGPPRTNSFLPEDYIDHRAASRASAIGLTLFIIVMACVSAAFLVTNRRWKVIRDRQDTINILYTQEAQKIEQLKQLETQRSQMMDRAEITAALLERVPRSVLLAELITSMPHEVTLLELTLKSKRIEAPPAAVPVAPKDAPKPRGLGGKSPTADPKADAKPEAQRPMPPKFQFLLTIVGVAAVNNDIAEYMSKLQACPLLANVELQYIKETILNDVGMRRFEIGAEIRPEADAHELNLDQRALPAAVDPIATGREEVPASKPHATRPAVSGLASFFGKQLAKPNAKDKVSRPAADASTGKDGDK